MDSWIPPWQGQTEGRNMAWMEGYGSGPWREVSHGPPPPHSRHNNYYHEFQVGHQPWLNTQVEYHHPMYHPRLQDCKRPNSRAEYYKSSNPNWSYARQGYENLPRGFVEGYAYGAYQRTTQTHPSNRDPRWRDDCRESAHTWKQPYSRDYPPEEGTVSSGYYDAGLTQSKLKDSCEDTDASKKDMISYDIRHHSPCSWDDFQENVLGNAIAAPAHEPSLLQQYKESGLSSSSSELRQYMEGSSNVSEVAFSKDWSPIQSDHIQAIFPHGAFQKFTLPHVPVHFGAGGQLVQGCPNDPAEGQPALVEIHSLQVILHDTAEQEAMRDFPGPLTREDLHKMDVMTFCQLRTVSGCDLSTNRGRDSALLWKLLLLLCRQNGSTVGSDTAELLMQDCKFRERYKRQEPQVNLINLRDEEWPMQNCGIMTDLLTGEIVPSFATPEQKIEKFTKLLFYGRKKDALDWAMRNQLWGHALFLSSKMDPRTYSSVLSGFTSTLAFNDPLQTLFQLMSGRIPQASLCCGDDKWGDWRPHLAVMLSNQIGDLGLNSKAIITMGDTLAGKGLIEAAHFCYLMANIPFGHYQVKTNCMVLLGSSQSQTFAQFARTECIHRTEILEYCWLLGSPQSFIPSFQVYKLMYASRLMDYGLTAQALHYCEGVGMALLAQNQNIYPVLLNQIIKLAEQLKFSDPELLEKADYDMALEPDWLVELRALYQQWEGGREPPSITSNKPEVKKNIASKSGLGPHFEYAENQAPWENPEQRLYSHRAPVYSPQHQLNVDQPLHIHRGHGHTSAITNVSLESCLLDSNQGSVLSSRGLSDDLSSHLNQASGGAVDACELKYFPGDQKLHIPEHLKAPSARTRTISENSTISMEENTPPEGLWEEASSEKLVEDAGQEQAKASGFGWFRWFRSKTNKNVEPSKNVSAAPLDLTAPVSQEKTAQPAFFPPMDETKTAQLHCFPPPPPLTDGKHFHKSSLEAKHPLLYNMEAAIFPDPGDQINSFQHQCTPDRVPPPHQGGRLSLFSPAQVISPASSGIGHLQRSFHQ